MLNNLLIYMIAGPYRHQQPVPRLIPLPQRDHLQPGALQLRLVVSTRVILYYYLVLLVYCIVLLLPLPQRKNF